MHIGNVICHTVANTLLYAVIGCNAYQACVDDLPSLSGPSMLGCVMVAGCGTSITDVEG